MTNPLAPNEPGRRASRLWANTLLAQGCLMSMPVMVFVAVFVVLAVVVACS